MQRGDKGCSTPAVLSFTKFGFSHLCKSHSQAAWVSIPDGSILGSPCQHRLYTTAVYSDQRLVADLLVKVIRQYVFIGEPPF